MPGMASPYRAQVPLSKLYWEDFTPGSVAEYGPQLVTREEIVAFSAEFDPQPMHLDEDAGRASMLTGLASSGWHSCALMMRIIADGFVLNSSSMGAPSVEEARWLAPLRPGDQLTVRATVLTTQASNSRKDMGVVRFLFEMFNAAGVRVMSLTMPVMLGRRAPAAAE
jgi:acyl dehydratase